MLIVIPAYKSRILLAQGQTSTFLDILNISFLPPAGRSYNLNLAFARGHWRKKKISLEAPTIVTRLVPALKDAKEFSYNVANLCETEEQKSAIVKWVPASAKDIEKIREEIQRSYDLCLQRLKPSTRPGSNLDPLPSQILKNFRGKLSDRWRTLSLSKLRDEKSGKLYVLYSWDSNQPVGVTKLGAKLGSESADSFIFLARNFGPQLVEKYGSKRNLALVDSATLAVAGGLPKDDPLLRELIEVTRPFLANPQKALSEAIASSSTPTIDSFVLQDVVRIFEEQTITRDCGHLHLPSLDAPYRSEVRSKLSLEEKLSEAGSLLLSISQSGVERLLNQMKQRKENVLGRLNELQNSEWVTTAVKYDMKGELITNEHIFLCKSCSKDFKEAYELPEAPPIEGLQFVLKGFVNKLGSSLQASPSFVDVYGLGMVKAPEGNLVVMLNPPDQPSGNVELFEPKLIIGLCNFFHGRRRDILTRPRLWSRVNERLEDPKTSAFKSVSNYLTGSLAYDCETDLFEHMGIAIVPPELNEMVRKISTISLTVKSTEKAFKAAHDQAIEQFKVMGLSFGLKVETEYAFGPDRLDVAWLERSGKKMEAAIEVELGSNPMGELWKMVEIGPRLAVLAVKGNQYDQTLLRIGESTILRERRQTLMVLDLTEGRFVLVRGNEILIEDGGKERAK